MEGELPAAPTVALAAARTHRRLLTTQKWSPEAHGYLERNLAELERRTNDETARTVPVQQAKAQTVQAESRNQVGIYVYALPH